MAVNLLAQQLRMFGQNKAVRGAGVLAIGTAVGQGIVMISAPLLTRLFTPAEMGQFGTFTALTSFFTAFVCLRFEQAILLVEDEEQPTAIANCLLSAACIAGLYEFAVLAAPLSVLNITENQRAAFIVLGPLTILSTALYIICQHLSLRNNRLANIARYQITKSVSGTALQVLAASVGMGFLGLVGGQSAGLVIAVVPIIAYNRRNLARAVKVRKGAMAALMRRFSSLPLYGAPQAALNATTASLPLLMIGSFFGSIEVGLFWLGLRVFGLPNQIVVESIRGSLLNEFSARLRERRELLRPLVKATLLMATLLLPVVLVLMLYGRTIFSIVFGQGWGPAGDITALLSVSWVFQNASVPSVALLQLLQRQKLLLVLEIGGTAARVLALGTAAVYPSLYLVLTLFVLANLLQSVIAVALTFSILHRGTLKSGEAAEQAKR